MDKVKKAVEFYKNRGPTIGSADTLFKRYPIVTLSQIIIVFWGLWVALPFTAFVGVNFIPLLLIMPEVVWGACGLALAAFSVIASITNQVLIYRIVMLMQAAFWLILVVLFGSAASSTAIPTYGSLFIIWLVIVIWVK